MINKLYTNTKNYIKENYKYLLFLILFFLIMTVRLPWTIYATGGIIDISSRLKGSLYESRGTLNMTYVTAINGTVPTLLLGAVNPKWDIVSNKDIMYEGETLKETLIRDSINMESSISNATYIAYKEAGLTPNIIKEKNYIVYVDESADTNVKIGDLILKYDNIKFESFLDFRKYISTKSIGDKIEIIVSRNDKEHKCYGKIIELSKEPKLGISVVRVNEYKNKPNVTYHAKKNESGPSGGMMLTLAMYNALTETDITNGKKIAGTGTIELDGSVGEIGGVKYKLAGAVKKKCDLFIVPEENYEEAIAEQKKHNYKIDIIKVKNFKEVLDYLKNN